MEYRECLMKVQALNTDIEGIEFKVFEKIKSFRFDSPCIKNLYKRIAALLAI